MNEPKKTLITLKNVAAGYDGRDVLRDVSMEVGSADFVGLTGPNGGGKTTLVKLLVGLVEPTSGIVERRTQRIGYLPQQNLFDRRFPITVDEVVVSGLQNRAGGHPDDGRQDGERRNGWLRSGGKFTREDFDRARNLLTVNGIAELARRPIGELSGGQLQRVLLCRALISEPELLVLDEPATFIDQKSEAELYETLARLHKKMAIVMVSHDAPALARIASRVVEVG